VNEMKELELLLDLTVFAVGAVGAWLAVSLIQQRKRKSKP